MKILYLGPEGSFSHVAARSIQSTYGADVQSMQTYGEIFGALTEDKKHELIAVVPVKNKISGEIPQVNSILNSREYKDLFEIIDEIPQSIVYCLLSKSEDLSFCNKIYLDEQARIQCSDFLQTINLMEQLPAMSSSDAVMKASKDIQSCAVGPAEATEIYDMQILNINVGNDKENWTKFAVIRKRTHPEDKEFRYSDPELESLRNEIDEIDLQILEKIKERLDVIKKVGIYKNSKNIPIVDKEREKVLFEKVMENAEKLGINRELAFDIWRRLIDESYKLEI